MSGPAETPAAPAAPPASLARRLLFVQQRPQQLLALAVRVGRVLGELLAGGGHVVVLGALAAAHDLRHCAADVDLGELQVAAVQAVAVAALELAAAGDAGVEHAGEVDRRRRARHLGGRPPAFPAASAASRRAGRCRRRPSRRGRPARTPRARARRPAYAPAPGRWPACPGRRPAPAAGAGPSRGCGSCAPPSTAGRRRCPRGVKPSPSASAATSATKTVQVWPRSGGPSLRAASRPNSTMSSTPWASACSSRNEPVPALQTRFMSASTTRPSSTLMNLASWPPISTIERLRPPSGSSRGGRGGVGDDLVLDDEPLVEPGKAARNTVAAASRPGPGEADGDHRGRQPSRRPRRPAPAPPRRGCPRCGDRRSPARRRWRASTSAALEPVEPRSRPRTAGAPRRRRTPPARASSSRTTAPGPVARRLQARRCGCARAARAPGSAGKPQPRRPFRRRAGRAGRVAAAWSGEAQRAERLEHAGLLPPP